MTVTLIYITLIKVINTTRHGKKIVRTLDSSHGNSREWLVSKASLRLIWPASSLGRCHHSVSWSLVPMRGRASKVPGTSPFVRLVTTAHLGPWRLPMYTQPCEPPVLKTPTVTGSHKEYILSRMKHLKYWLFYNTASPVSSLWVPSVKKRIIF